MSKKKKRTKRYSGEDAKVQQAGSSEPVVHRYEAVERSRLGEWWHERKRMVKISAVIAALSAGVIWLLVELFQIVF
ncbi:MAG TPA: hypothetical protein PLN95_01435 [Candidatus Saccharibacteria bacterium]|nr:hypothetical protein [Candidatus Saccharibacteria bacterium]